MRATKEIFVRIGQREDNAAILSLLRSTLGEGAISKTPAFWSWKHERNPFGASPVLVAEAESRIIGVRVFMRWRWRSGGNVIDSVRAVDTATDRDWQGKGIFTKLTLKLVEEVEKEPVAFVFNTPNRHSGPGYLKMGWSSVGSVTLYVRPCHPIRILGEQIRRTIREVPTTPADDWNIDERNRAALVLSAQDPATFLQCRSSDVDPRLSTDRSLEFLMWRYVDIPELSYSVAIEEEEGTSACLVHRMVYRGSLRELRLCELLTTEAAASVGILRGLIKDAIHHARPDYVAAMAASGTFAQKALQALGFVPIPRLGPLLTVRPLRLPSEIPSPLLRSSWRLAIGDLEIF